MRVTKLQRADKHQVDSYVVEVGGKHRTVHIPVPKGLIGREQWEELVQITIEQAAKEMESGGPDEAA